MNNIQQPETSSFNKYAFLGLLFALPSIFMWILLGLEFLDPELSNAFLENSTLKKILANKIFEAMLFIVLPILTLGLGIASRGKGKEKTLSTIVINFGTVLIVLGILASLR